MDPAAFNHYFRHVLSFVQSLAVDHLSSAGRIISSNRFDFIKSLGKIKWRNHSTSARTNNISMQSFMGQLLAFHFYVEQTDDGSSELIIYLVKLQFQNTSDRRKLNRTAAIEHNRLFSVLHNSKCCNRLTQSPTSNASFPNACSSEKVWSDRVLKSRSSLASTLVEAHSPNSPSLRWNLL